MPAGGVGGGLLRVLTSAARSLGAVRWPFAAASSSAAPRLLSDPDADDGSSETTHLVLLCVMGGVLLASSLEAVQHRLKSSWVPAASLAVATGLVLGLFIRLSTDPDQLPEDLVFNGTIFFLVALPVIIFEAGYSLRKKEFFGQLFTILALSVLGTGISAGVIGAILYAAGNAGASLKLNINEALAYGSILSATDALATVSVIKDIGGVDPAFIALVQGEGSVNDAVSIVLFQTFAGFYREGIQDDTAQDFLSHFASELLGSATMGVAIGVAASVLFRFIHMGWLPDVRDARFCCTRPRDYYLAKAAAAVAPGSALRRVGGPGGGGAVSAAAESRGERVAFARAYSVVYSSLGPLSPPAKGASGGDDGLVHATGAPVSSSAADVAAATAAAEGITPEVATWLRLSRPIRLRDRRLLEPKPLTSVFAQTSYTSCLGSPLRQTSGYVAYLAAEASHFSGVVSVLFAGIALNHFVRPLLTREGKEFSEGTVRVLSSTADTAVFFQVGLDIALTMGTTRGIDTAAEGEMVGWVFLALIVSRAAAIFPLAAVFNYFRREKLSWRHQVLLWHCAIRGAGVYAFALVFPTSNKDVLVDLTAAMVLISVLFQASTMKPLFMLLGVGDAGHHGDAGHDHSTAGEVDSDDDKPAAQLLHGGDGGGGGSRDGAGGSGGGGGASTTDADGQGRRASNWDTVVVGGARVYLPLDEPTRAERVVTWLNRVDTQVRWIVSGIVRGQEVERV